VTQIIFGIVSGMIMTAAAVAQSPPDFRLEYDDCGRRQLRWGQVAAADTYLLEYCPFCCADCLCNPWNGFFLPLAVLPSNSLSFYDSAQITRNWYRVLAISQSQVLGSSIIPGDGLWAGSLSDRMVPIFPDVCDGQTIRFALSDTVVRPLQYEWRRNGLPIAVTAEPAFEYSVGTGDDGVVISVAPAGDCGAAAAIWPALRIGRGLPLPGTVRWTGYQRVVHLRRHFPGVTVNQGGCAVCFTPAVQADQDLNLTCVHDDDLRSNGATLRAGGYNRGWSSPNCFGYDRTDQYGYGCRVEGVLVSAALARIRVTRPFACIEDNAPSVFVRSGDSILFSVDCGDPLSTTFEADVEFPAGPISVELSSSISSSAMGIENDVITEITFLPPSDCNGNGQSDTVDISTGLSLDRDGNQQPDECQTVRVPGQYPTIQAAIDAGPPGIMRIVLVAPGTYAGPISLNGKPVIVRGTAGAASTVIEGTSGQQVSVIRFTGAEPPIAAIEGLTIRGGTSGSPILGAALVGGGVFGVDSAASVRDCIIEENAAGCGGGMYFLRCFGSVTGTIIRNNAASADGGGFQANQGGMQLTDVVIEGNFANSRGGGVHLVQGSSRLTRVHVQNNVCGNIVGGISFSPSGAVPMALELTDCAITENSALVDFGGLATLGSVPAPVRVSGTTICRNAPRPNVWGPIIDQMGNSICDCLADVSADGVVNGADLGILLAQWGPADANTVSDINRDGRVDGSDLGFLLANWGPCPN
jgi:hypothetical protein